MAESGIYEIVNLVNGKRYVGSAVDFRKRWRLHRLHLRRGTHHSPHLQRSWIRHGEDSFEFRAILFCEPDQLLEEENAEFRRRKPEFNVCPEAGSTRGRKFSDKTKAKIAAKARGRKRPPRSAEHRAKLSAARKGKMPAQHVLDALQAGRRAKVWTAEEKESRAEGMRRAYAEGRHRRDRPPEYRNKIAATLREKSNSPVMRKKLSDQARQQWAAMSAEERAAKMERVRAGQKRA